MGSSSDGGGAKMLPRLLFIAGLLTCVLALAACGSSSSSSSSSSGSTEAESTEEGSSGGSALTTTYAPGVKTLQELYEGNEATPPESGPKAKKGANVIWVSCGGESPGCSKPAEYFLEAAKALGWNAKVIDGKLNVNNGYSNALRTAIAAKPDAIIAHGINCEEVKASLQEAKAANMPIVEASSVDCPGEEFYSVPEIFSEEVGNTQEFYEQYAENQADYAIDKTEGKAKVILAEYQGPWGNNMGEAWKREFDKCSECEILDTIPLQASELAPNGPVFQRFTTDLVKYPEANAAVFAFDTLVTYTGLSKAVVDAGRANDMVVVGGEGFAEAIQLITENKGNTAEGGAYDNSWASWAIADETNRFLNGEESVPQGIGFRVIDKTNNLPPAGQDYSSEFDYKKAYEEVWSGK